MTRFIANYTIVAGVSRVLINHVTTIDNEGRLVSCEPFETEQADVRYIDSPVVIVPDDYQEGELSLNLQDTAKSLSTLSVPVGKRVRVVYNTL